MTHYDGPRTAIAPCGLRIEVRRPNVEGWQDFWSWRCPIGSKVYLGPLWTSCPTDDEVLVTFEANIGSFGAS